MNQLNIDFSDPEFGWIIISVDNGVDSITIEADSKFNSFQELTMGLFVLTSEDNQFTVTWLEEPDVTEWRFTKFAEDIVFENWRLPFAKTAELKMQFSGSFQEVCIPFWRALQALKNRWERAELEKSLEDDFPFIDLERLTAEIESRTL
jgi:hypothetical protein